MLSKKFISKVVVRLFSLIFLILVVFSGIYIYHLLQINKINKNNPRPITPLKVVEKINMTIIDTSKYNICAPNVNPVYTNPNYDHTRDEIQEIIGYKNNKFGIYTYMEVGEYLDLANELVNSNGGEWGYVLVPYNVKDYRDDIWQDFFVRLNELKLIPIIQLWDLNKDNADSQINDSAKFLNTLPWPTKNRYISVFNEVNDEKFWHNEINTEYYAKILNQIITTYKKENSNFFILNGAFNASARNTDSTMDEEQFLIRMEQKVPGVLAKLDGWASHSYPQPNFTGSPLATGRDSIKAYDWELGILKNRFGIENLPVFITETGWPHKEAETNRNDYLPMSQVASNLVYAYENIWLPDERVVAVTPFTIWYNPPYDNFSWVSKDNKPLFHFNEIAKLAKVADNPPQLEAIWKCKE